MSSLGIRTSQETSIYSENILNQFLTFNDAFTWNVVSGGSNGVAENTAAGMVYAGEKAIQVTFTDTGVLIVDSGGTQSDVTIPKDGNYIISYRIAKNDVDASMDVGVYVYVNGILLTQNKFEQTLFTDNDGYIDDVWNCYFQYLTLQEDDVVSFQFDFQSDVIGSKLFFDGLKLELVDRELGLPSYYLEPLGTSPNSNFVFVNSLQDLPTPTTGVITLVAGVNYFFCTTVDLLGNRLQCGANTTILGGSSENCRIKSSGLSSSIALISSEWSLPINNVTIEHDLALDLDATGNANQAIDWNGVNFTDCATIGVIKNYSNVIVNGGAFLNSQGLTLDGSIGTIAFDNCLFDCETAGTVLILPSTLTITRRFRVTYSSFVVESGETGINVSTSATIPNSSYILDNVNFSGGGTYTTGVLYSDNKASFNDCKGITNSGSIAQYYMTSNATATTVSVINTYYKIAGVTLSGTYVEKFTLTDNKALYVGALSGLYKVSAMVSLTSGNTNVISARIAKNGTTSEQSTSKTTTSGTGKSENVGCFDIVSLSTNDYIEIFVANDTLSNITVSELTVIIERLN